MSLVKKVTDAERFWSKVDKRSEDECWNWLAARAGRNKNYGSFSSGALTNHKSGPAHRFSYWLNIGEIPDGLEVMHKCDNGLCVNPKHLEVGSRKQNMEDAKARGRLNPYDRRGEKNSNAKLTEGDVARIRDLLEQGYTQQSIADLYGVHQAHVSHIKLRKGWKNE